ncbi:AAA family ATPase [Rice orange leaf phytoplasma]|uniref:AAA family ATPase n=1 Tax=Rice orange leaf phytoplasma TaxID=146897 RepID=UPI000B3170C9
MDFLQNPKKYEYAGDSIPKGVLFFQVLQEQEKPYLQKHLQERQKYLYAASGSEFDGILVGLGARKIQKLFTTIKYSAPCILFIDEIDTLGKKRGGLDNKHEQTLNQLLTEMDGFTKSLGVIIIGATNRVDMLDSALLRPGRFDRQFNVGLPDIKARQAILKVHARNKKNCSKC